MGTPETRYAHSGSVSIAYQIAGKGQVDLVFIPGWVSHIEYAWEERSFAPFLERMAGFSRLIVMDRRGTGLSDRAEELPTLEQRMDDVGAVIDAAGFGATLTRVGRPAVLLQHANWPVGRGLLASALDDRAERSARERVGDEVVPVADVAQREEQRAGREDAGVERATREHERWLDRPSRHTPARRLEHAAEGEHRKRRYLTYRAGCGRSGRGRSRRRGRRPSRSRCRGASRPVARGRRPRRSSDRSPARIPRRC